MSLILQPVWPSQTFCNRSSGRFLVALCSWGFSQNHPVSQDLWQEGHSGRLTAWPSGSSFENMQMYTVLWYPSLSPQATRVRSRGVFWVSVAKTRAEDILKTSPPRRYWWSGTHRGGVWRDGTHQPGWGQTEAADLSCQEEERKQWCPRKTQQDTACQQELWTGRVYRWHVQERVGRRRDKRKKKRVIFFSFKDDVWG